jgi:hypothetical protein
VLKAGDKFKHYKGEIYQVITIAADGSADSHDPQHELIIYENVKTRQAYYRKSVDFLGTVNGVRRFEPYTAANEDSIKMALDPDWFYPDNG